MGNTALVRSIVTVVTELPQRAAQLCKGNEYVRRWQPVNVVNVCRYTVGCDTDSKEDGTTCSI
jgi:hypothetical protein